MILTSMQREDLENLKDLFARPCNTGGQLSWRAPEWIDELERAIAEREERESYEPTVRGEL